MSKSLTRELHLGPGRILRATPVFDTYWHFAKMRQEVFHRRVRGEAPPWTTDPVIKTHRFTNAYRASDRVSQYLIREVLYKGEQSAEEIFFRCLLFKLFNRIDTWERLTRAVGEISLRDYSFERYASVLDAMMTKSSIYSAAYIMPSPAFGDRRKHRNHLKLLEEMVATSAPQKISDAPSLKTVFEILSGYRSLGRFLAFQFTIDLNYSRLCNFSEMDYVVAGPGARDGIRKCFADTSGLDEEDVIKAVAERAEAEFERLDIQFEDLWGRKLQLIDCQNLFCEVDKYARVMHPEFSGASGRVRIKQKFLAVSRPCPQWYPPRWNVVPQQSPSSPVTQSRSSPTQLSLPV